MNVILLLYSISGLLIILLLVVFFKKNGTHEDLVIKLDEKLREEFRVSREESASLMRSNREELSNSIGLFGKEQREIFSEFKKTQQEFTNSTTQKLEAVLGKVEELMKATKGDIQKENENSRSNIAELFRGFTESFDRSIKSFNDLQREKFGALETKQGELVTQTEKKLDEMRATVDEKLTKTLNERIGQSFEQVSKHLESVQQGLGEMRNIASDVGGLKKVLSNVKLRGGIGEVQLAMLLEQTLSPTQYDSNVCTKKGSSETVEFAVKLPGKGEDENDCVYLPIDAKFPKDIYEGLLKAYDEGDPEKIEECSKALETTMKKMAKDIRDKYIDPPHTTDFALLFLPFEGIYAEVVRRSALVDQLQREFKVAVAGPTTLTAYLNSLQMGFRTLALQKRSSEVWEVLGAVKTEFETFGGMLAKVQKNINLAGSTVDELLGKRTRAIQRKLKTVESLPVTALASLLPEPGITVESADDEE